MRYFSVGYQSGKWSETFYTDVKIIENVKKQTVLKKDGRFQG